MSPRHRFAACAALALVVVATAAHAGEIRLSPADVAGLAKGGAGAGTSGVGGIRTTVLAGDPSAAGPYTIAITVPPHTIIAAHSHRDDRTAVVVSGVWWFGYGPLNTQERLKPLPPGSFYTEPGGEAHFARTGDTAAVVYITGVGPTDTRYVDPAKEPRP